MNQPTVYLAMPRYSNTISAGAARGFYLKPARKCRVALGEASVSMLPQCFNTLWCTALNHRKALGLTHFAMLHSDVEPADYWLDTLVDEMRAVDADVLSVVVPIKNDCGLTSTGLANDARPFSDVRRLTMREVMEFPQTFCSAELGNPDLPLVVNTGCWVCRFDDDWVEQVQFEFRNRIVRDESGVYRCESEPEDWLFSRWAHTQGLKVYATRKVAVQHAGERLYPNTSVWGAWDFDEQYMRDHR